MKPTIAPAGPSVSPPRNRASVQPKTKADLNDQRWLNERVDALRDGIEAARDIWLNWTEIRNVSRLADGQSYGDFIKSRLGYALPLTEVLQIMPGASSREIAKVADVTGQAVRKGRSKVATELPPDEAPATVLGSDGKSYPARVVRTVEAEVIEPAPTVDAPAPGFGHLDAALKLIEKMTGGQWKVSRHADVARIVAEVPPRRSHATSVRLVHAFLFIDEVARGLRWRLGGDGPSEVEALSSALRSALNSFSELGQVVEAIDVQAGMTVDELRLTASTLRELADRCSKSAAILEEVGE